MTMSLTVGRRVAGGAFITVAALAARPDTPRMHSPGVIYTVTSIQESQSASGASRVDTSVSVNQYAGDDGRTDVRRMPASLAHRGDSLARAFGSAPGQYTLQKRGSATVTVVDTTKHQYFERNADSAMKSLTQLGPQPEVHTSDTAVATRVQPDSIVEGLHVQHWRVRGRFTIRMLSFESAVRLTVDKYIATESTDMRFGFPGDGPDAPRGMSAYWRELRDANAKLPHGLDVLTITQAETDFASVHRASTQTTRMSDIRYVDIPAEVFAVPSGYQRVAPPTFPSFGSPQRPQ
jgi:hypothetical protein